MPPKFRHGDNIAMKVPPHLMDAMVGFYRDVIGLEVLGREGDSWIFRFGALRLWLDSVPAVSQPELWLELKTDDVEAAARHLGAHGPALGITRCDAIEPLPEGFPGFWIAAPGGMIHLVARDDG